MTDEQSKRLEEIKGRYQTDNYLPSDEGWLILLAEEQARELNEWETKTYSSEDVAWMTARREIATLREENERLTKTIRECPTCEGSGAMDVVVKVLPSDGREVFETVECAECHGTAVSSWGQAIDEVAAIRAENERLKAAEICACVITDDLCARLAESKGMIEEAVTNWHSNQLVSDRWARQAQGWLDEESEWASAHK